MIHSQRQPVAISLRLYRALARAFPYEFKNAYGEELLQVTEDAIEPIWRRHGLLGLLRLLADIAVRVPVEHLIELRQDISYGLRMLRGSPGFTAVAVISLTLGIGVATAGFSNIHATILSDVPGVAQPGQLVALQAPTSYPYYKRYRELTDLFSSTLAYVAPVPFGVLLGGRTERALGHLVTPSYFSTLGVHPALGRLLSEENEQSGAEPAVVVSYRFWESRLGSDPAIVGRTLRVNGHACTVIGVGPKEFLGASPMIFVADLWLPLSAGERVAPELAGNALERRDRTMFHVVGRLRPGVTALRAEAEMDAVARQLMQSYGEEDKTQKGRLVRLTTGGRLVPIREQDLGIFLALPLVLLGLILLIACSNVANMMIARAASRRREIAVRLSLGASRARLVRQLLTESMLVSTSAGVPRVYPHNVADASLFPVASRGVPGWCELRDAGDLPSGARVACPDIHALPGGIDRPGLRTGACVAGHASRSDTCAQRRRRYQGAQASAFELAQHADGVPGVRIAHAPPAYRLSGGWVSRNSEC